MTTHSTIRTIVATGIIGLLAVPAMAQYGDRYSEHDRRDGFHFDRFDNDRFEPASWRRGFDDNDVRDERGECDYERNRSRQLDAREDSWRRFQETSYQRNLSRDRSAIDSFQSRGGSALDNYLRDRGFTNEVDDYRLRDDYGLTERTNRFRYNDRFDDRSEDRTPRYNPLTPPLPRRDGGDDAAALTERITTRYQNPINVRTIRSLSNNQAVQLFREVSAQTDGRHLEPSTYDLRVRRALRNLALTMENPAATRALGISTDSFRVDGFRDSLSRTWDGMNIQSRTDAERVMQTVMQQAQQVPGMTPGVVAFEFASSTVDTLDRFSALEPSEPARGPSAALESEMVGVGVEIKEHEDGLLLVRALRGGPAAAAGLQAGDMIVAIDGRSIAGMPMSRSVDLIKGVAGSRVQFEITRDGARPGQVTITRRRFRVWTVNDVRMVSGTSVGYINLSQFAQSSTQEVDQALQQLHNSGMKSLILDVRGNPGGLLTTCVQITNRFLPCGTIVSTKGRLTDDNMQETATFSRTWGMPLVVLVDGDSASASEILAAAVQDNERGVVVGQQSYGKGTVQTHFPLQSINGNLRLTTARFYSPSGRAMSGSGVTPDVRVADDDGVANGDKVMVEAVRIAQSRQLKEMAVASGRCRTKSAPQYRNSFNGAMYDAVQPRTVLR